MPRVVLCTPALYIHILIDTQDWLDPAPTLTWLDCLPHWGNTFIYMGVHTRTHTYTQNNTRKPLPQRHQLWIYMLHTVIQSQLSLLPRQCFYHFHKNCLRVLVKSLAEAHIHNICKRCPELPNNLLRNIMRSIYPDFFWLWGLSNGHSSLSNSLSQGHIPLSIKKNLKTETLMKILLQQTV